MGGQHRERNYVVESPHKEPIFSPRLLSKENGQSNLNAVDGKDRVSLEREDLKNTIILKRYTK